MRNQTSFRLTTTLLPSDTTAKTTQVINKLDSTGAKFYPTFTEETLVLTNDDRTVMETTRATCNNGVLTFVKRGLSDDSSATPVENRKLTWNPGSLCFITAGAGDWIDKDDDIIWTGNQTYTGDLVSTGSATYRGALITEKGVQYPHFDSLEDLQAYADPFGGMFAVVDSDGELYRYNAEQEAWSVVTTSTPAQPAQASTVAIGTVRGATDAEFAAGVATGSNGELLIATPAQIQTGSSNVKVFELEGTLDTEGAQEILDFALSGGCPILYLIKNGNYIHYYLRVKRSTSLEFSTIVPNYGTDGGGDYIVRKQVKITYSGTDVSSITEGDGLKVYVTSVPED